MTPKRKRGRPRGAKPTSRLEQLFVRVHSEERKLVDKAVEILQADEPILTRSEWMRRLMLEAARAVCDGQSST